MSHSVAYWSLNFSAIVQDASAYCFASFLSDHTEIHDPLVGLQVCIFWAQWSVCDLFLGLQVAMQTNAELLQLPDKYEASDSAAILAQVSADLISPAESTRLEALHWVSLTLLTPLLPEFQPSVRNLDCSGNRHL